MYTYAKNDNRLVELLQINFKIIAKSLRLLRLNKLDKSS